MDIYSNIKTIIRSSGNIDIQPGSNNFNVNIGSTNSNNFVNIANRDSSTNYVYIGRGSLSSNYMYIGDYGISTIYIGNSSSNISFAGTSLNTIGKTIFDYYTIALSSSMNYTISTNKTIIILTSITSGAGILKILNDSSSTPSYGQLKIIVNAFTQEIRLKCPTTGSNIKNQATNDDFLIYGNSLAILVYYGGYWRPQMDRF